MPLMFPAITGHASSVSVLDAMEILGADLSRYRLRQALELLGGASRKPGMGEDPRRHSRLTGFLLSMTRPAQLRASFLGGR